MALSCVRAAFAFCCLLSAASSAQTFGGSRLRPNLVDNIDRPLRYRPDGADFVIENGGEFFNRPLYGGNTAFRVDGGDRPEFVLYLPGRGGNLRFGLRTAKAAKWLHAAAAIEMRYRPGTLRYEIRDPLLGPTGVLRLAVFACHQTEGLIVRAEVAGAAAGVELLWAYGGVNGQRGKRDGDIGTENVPISEWFQLQPEFCRDNAIELGDGTFTLRAKAATIVGVVPAGAQLARGDASHWDDLAALLESAGIGAAREGEAARRQAAALHVVVGRLLLRPDAPVLLSLQRVTTEAAATEELDTYRTVTAERPGVDRRPAKFRLAGPFAVADLARLFDESERAFTALRTRVTVDTPDPFLNAAVGALNIAADAVWDEPDQAIMHGAIAWRTKLLGWRGPYALDALGWHDRARQHFTTWAGRQNTDPIPPGLPPADEKANLARNETGLHSNGDMSNSHYDMNLVYIDALFRHLRWTGDIEFAKKMWPVIERHLAWERRLFRREFGPEKLPLYEAYAAIWASDDLQYHGGGATHATAFNYSHNLQAAQLARRLGQDPSIYQREAQLIERGIRALLWVEDDAVGSPLARSTSPFDELRVPSLSRDSGPRARRGAGATESASKFVAYPKRGWFAEFKDLLGRQQVHPSAALWTFYHTMDSEVPTPQEAWQMTRQVDTQIPHLPVRGPGVPDGLYTLATSNWMPYDWSINNVVMAEVIHTALGFWQAGRADEAWRMTKGSLLAAMFMGISPGNVGSMSYLDVYRRESQRDFADGSGVLSRALIEGLFGVTPDALTGEYRVAPGFPAEWERATLRHPDFSVAFKRERLTDTYALEQRFARSQALRLRLVAVRDRIETVMVNGRPAPWYLIESAVGMPRIEILSGAAARHDVRVTWTGAVPIARADPESRAAFTRVQQGQMRWWQMAAAADAGPALPPGEPTFAGGKPLPLARFEPIDLSARFNDRVTQIFKNEYRSPRSPFVSLALPKQGLGGWAGGMSATAEIDDSGLRTLAARNGGRITLPNGVVFETPGGVGDKNVVFTSQWDNYPPEAILPLSGRARQLFLLMAGSTNHMQSRCDNGEVIATYADGSTDRLALENPTTWWPIEQDYFIDDFQFRRPEPLPIRVDLKTGIVRVLELNTFKGKGGKVPGGAATVLELRLNPEKELQSLTVRALANEVVIGLMAATLAR